MVLCFVSLCSFAQVSPNIGFDDGTFNHWDCWTGMAKDLNSLSISGPIGLRHTILTGPAGVDRYGNFPVICPNGSKYSIQLGNDGTGALAERVSYTLKVPSSGEYTIIFDYAVVLQNPTHVSSDQPRFTAKVYDVTDGKYIDCPSFDFIAGSNTPGFKLVQGDLRNTEVYYKEWSKATIDVHGYANKTLRIEFTTNDCLQGGHFGYAYLDVEDTENTPPITGNAYCANQNEVTLLGPSGFAEYTWYNDDKTQILGTGRSLHLSPAPPNNTPIKLHIVPFLDLGCPDDLSTVINKIGEEFKLVVPNQINVCASALPFDLTAKSITAGSSPATFSYFNDADATDEISSPSTIHASGTYYIRALSKDGCSVILPVNVSVKELPSITLTAQSEVTYPNKLDLSALFTHDPENTYGYYSDAKTQNTLDDYHVNHNGVYYIKATNKFGCETIKTINVKINAPPPIIVTAPNTFTPNNDGVNDRFAFTAIGSYTFLSLKIFNRNGQLLTELKSQDQQWDGTLKGKKLPMGVYYWVFEGRDDYSGVLIHKGGSIALIY
jgi:gliding motility-associated-like protein